MFIFISHTLLLLKINIIYKQWEFNYNYYKHNIRGGIRNRFPLFILVNGILSFQDLQIISRHSIPFTLSFDYSRMFWKISCCVFNETFADI